MKAHSKETCPIAVVATLLSDTWTMLIIRDLLKSKMRFSELERSLVGISSRTLTAKLKNLEEAQVIEKDDTHYTITKQGSQLGKVIDAMAAYGKKHK
jgi:DNA-binding HxlR family transcriptional regulator